jgi:hypothetical protein
VFAQHCPFDNMAIIVVEVSDSISMKKIYDLEIVLRHENGDAVISHNQDTLFFCQNPQATSNEWYNDKFKKIRYEFADDNYILPLSMNWKKESLFIHIHDPSNTFDDKVVRLEPKYYYDIHKNLGVNWYDIKDGVSVLGEGSFSDLIKVVLRPKK